MTEVSSSIVSGFGADANWMMSSAQSDASLGASPAHTHDSSEHHPDDDKLSDLTLMQATMEAKQANDAADAADAAAMKFSQDNPSLAADLRANAANLRGRAGALMGAAMSGRQSLVLSAIAINAVAISAGIENARTDAFVGEISEGFSNNNGGYDTHNYIDNFNAQDPYWKQKIAEFHADVEELRMDKRAELMRTGEYVASMEQFGLSHTEMAYEKTVDDIAKIKANPDLSPEAKQALEVEKVVVEAEAKKIVTVEDAAALDIAKAKDKTGEVAEAAEIVNQAAPLDEKIDIMLEDKNSPEAKARQTRRIIEAGKIIEKHDRGDVLTEEERKRYEALEAQPGGIEKAKHRVKHAVESLVENKEEIERKHAHKIDEMHTRRHAALHGNPDHMAENIPKLEVKLKVEADNLANAIQKDAAVAVAQQPVVQPEIPIKQEYNFPPIVREQAEAASCGGFDCADTNDNSRALNVPNLELLRNKQLER